MTTTSTTSVRSHILGIAGGQATGPCLVVLGGIHGNEPSGVEASRSVLERLQREKIPLRGSVVFLVGNLAALERRCRYVHLDLNRQWTPARVQQVLSRDLPVQSEDREQRELIEVLRTVVADSRRQHYFLDLHTSSSAGPPFVTVGDTLRNRKFAQQFPLPLILGLEEQVDGALLELLNNHGFITLGVEAGQHDAPESVEVHEAVLWLALVASGTMRPEAFPDLERYRRRLEQAHAGLPRIVEVRHRHAITEDQGFSMEPGYRSFAPVRKGQIVAHDDRGPVAAPDDGMLLLPLYQGQGDDGFFVAREVRPMWLNVSAALRRMRVAGLLRLLPGVHRHPELAEVYVVNTHIARWFPLEVFHLFGFRKLRKTGQTLLVSRRRYDLSPPPQVSFV